MELSSALSMVHRLHTNCRLTGFAGQVERARGTETNSLFMAEAGWEPNLTAEEFYKDYP